MTIIYHEPPRKDGEHISRYLNRLLRGNAPIDVCDTVHLTDERGRTVEVFYRIINACPHAQTDISENMPVIEQVLYEGRRVKLGREGKRWLYEQLHEQLSTNQPHENN